MGVTRSSSLEVICGQYTDRGRKAVNQDRLGLRIPEPPVRSAKGIVLALADGISSSSVSQLASDTAIATFLDDYYLTSDAWSVRTSGERVIAAINSKLYAETRRSEFRFDKDRGYVCTLTALVVKSRTAHFFHVGDARVYALERGELLQLTEDHRLQLSAEASYLSRALGVNPSVDVDYVSCGVDADSLFVIATDGVHEHCRPSDMLTLIERHSDDLDRAACAIATHALEHGSNDNLSVQLVRVKSVPSHDAVELLQASARLPFVPELKPGSRLDAYRIERQLYVSHRSHVYLAIDETNDQAVALKVPSVEQHQDNAYLERFMLEEWIARRIDSPHVVRSAARAGAKSYFYVVNEYVEGTTLSQWMRDYPSADLERVRRVIEQVARGLQAFHRQEMIHQDLRPDNILIDERGTAKIIDFGSTRVAGLEELSILAHEHILGTVQYTAPECFLGQPGSSQSDLYSLGVICYQMLSGRLPYGARVARARTRAAQQRLAYESVLDEKRAIPVWIDDTLRRAVHVNPSKRYAELSEFVYDLRHPNAAFMRRTQLPLFERNPALFWRRVSLVLFVIIIVLLWRSAARNARSPEGSPGLDQQHHPLR